MCDGILCLQAAFTCSCTLMRPCGIIHTECTDSFTTQSKAFQNSLSQNLRWTKSISPVSVLPCYVVQYIKHVLNWRRIVFLQCFHKTFIKTSISQTRLLSSVRFNLFRFRFYLVLIDESNLLLLLDAGLNFYLQKWTNWLKKNQNRKIC